MLYPPLSFFKGLTCVFFNPLSKLLFFGIVDSLGVSGMVVAFCAEWMEIALSQISIVVAL